ncbi:Trehalose transport system permease protein SugB [compost metagenome]
MGNLNLLNQYGLIIQYVTFSLAQGVFLCVGHLKNVPFELDEASKIDGCGTWTTFMKIIYPLMTPILVTITVLNTLWIWNDFQLPLILLNKSSDYWTLPLFIYNFRGEYTFNYPVIFAGLLLTIIPVLILYAFLQKKLIGGLIEGSLK